MRSLIRHVSVWLILISIFASNASGWCFKEHILFARLAALHLLENPSTPPAMKAWLHDAFGDIADINGQREYFLHTHIGTKPEGFTGISYWVYMPDIHALIDPAASRVAPFGVHERLLHFVDVELFQAGDVQRDYRHDLSHEPKLDDIPHDMKDPRYIQAGMLPFRIEQCYRELVSSMHENRLTAPSIRQQEGKTAVYWAGYLAHYSADNTQPQHATLDYKSQSYFADKRRSPNVHAEVEYRMCDDEVNEFASLRREFWPMFVKELAEFDDPVQTKDLWRASVEVSLKSYEALPLIGLAAMHATRQGGTPDHPQGAAGAFDTEDFFHFKGPYMGREMSVMEMKAIQTAWAVKRIETVWRQAWEEANPAH